MSTSHIQWAGIPTSQENKRGSLDTFAEPAEGGTAEQQQELLSSIQRAVEQERHRIAEDLHDTVAQDVALALHKLEHIQHLLEQSQLYQAFQEVTHVTRILENGLDSLRNSIEPRQFAEQTSFTSLMTLIQEYQRDHSELQLDCRVEPLELLTQFPSELEAPIFRFVQQALHNIWQHASATHVTISLAVVSHVLTVEVSDNGKGFSPQLEEDKLLPYGQSGLQIMRERIEHANGAWKIESQPGGGTSVYAAFPLKGSA